MHTPCHAKHHASAARSLALIISHTASQLRPCTWSRHAWPTLPRWRCWFVDDCLKYPARPDAARQAGYLELREPLPDLEIHLSSVRGVRLPGQSPPASYLRRTAVAIRTRHSDGVTELHIALYAAPDTSASDQMLRDDTSLAIDGQGIVYVADFNNVRIHKFDRAGHFLTEWPIERRIGPTGVTVDSFGNVYVVNHQKHPHYYRDWRSRTRAASTRQRLQHARNGAPNRLTRGRALVGMVGPQPGGFAPGVAYSGSGLIPAQAEASQVLFLRVRARAAIVSEARGENTYDAQRGDEDNQFHEFR
jgi:hypothetical protein